MPTERKVTTFKQSGFFGENSIFKVGVRIEEQRK